MPYFKRETCWFTFSEYNTHEVQVALVFRVLVFAVLTIRGPEKGKGENGNYNEGKNAVLA